MPNLRLNATTPLVGTICIFWESRLNDLKFLTMSFSAKLRLGGRTVQRQVRVKILIQTTMEGLSKKFPNNNQPTNLQN
jgi:hypothetical protein